MAPFLRFVRLLACTVCFFGAISPSFAAYQWGFANVSLNYLNWDAGTETKSTKRDFFYLEVEGGGQYTWGDVYGFFDIENFDKSGNEVRTGGKGVLHYNLGATGFSLYGHVYNIAELGFSEQNRVLGFSYALTGLGWWFKPFVGVHDVSQTYFSGMNGYMGGWIAGYNFKIGQQNFMLSGWHELEFFRDEAYASGNGGKRTSHNGALAGWWTVIPEITVGLQWRYATDKLGTPGAMNAAIGTLRYNF